MDAVAGWAKLLFEAFMFLSGPLPATAHIDRPAFGAEHGRVGLLSRLVRIVFLFFDVMGLDFVAARLSAVEVSCFHVCCSR